MYLYTYSKKQEECWWKITIKRDYDMHYLYTLSHSLLKVTAPLSIGPVCIAFPLHSDFTTRISDLWVLSLFPSWVHASFYARISDNLHATVKCVACGRFPLHMWKVVLQWYFRNKHGWVLSIGIILYSFHRSIRSRNTWTKWQEKHWWAMNSTRGQIRHCKMSLVQYPRNLAPCYYSRQ